MTDLSGSVDAPDVRSGNDDTFELSVAQSGLWLAQELHPEVPFTIAQYSDLRGPVDLGLLRHFVCQAARELQSPQLRFDIVDGRPQQYVDPDLDPGFNVIDLSDCPDPADSARRWMAHHLEGGIDLSGTDVTTSVLFTLGPDRCWLYGRTPHVAMDGFGAGQPLLRTAELYSAAIEEHVAAPTRAVPVAEIVAAEQRYRSSARFTADRDYWAEQLVGLDRVTHLVGGFAAPSARPHIAGGALDSVVTARLDAVADRNGTGIAEVLVAATIGFLARMTGDSDVTVSLPVAARTTAALRRSAGMVSNVVPLRVPAVADCTVGELMRKVRLRMIGALRHQLYRHEDLLRDHGAQVTGRGGFGPLINVLTFPDSIGFGPAQARAHLLTAGPVEDLAISAYRFGAGPLSVDFHANPALYGADEVDGYRRQFGDWLYQFLDASPDVAVSALLTADRRDGVRRQRARHRLLPELLAQGIGDGHRIAVRGQGRSLTYRDLDRMTAQWARELRDHRAGPEAVVAVALERSVESVMALWAVARSGAVFFPVNPADPPARVMALIGDSRARLGITLGRWRLRLAGTNVEWLELDSDEFVNRTAGRSVAPVTDAQRTWPLRAAHPAYLIYTSGSTGTPKGVLSTHEGLASLADELVTRERVHGGSTVLQAHSPFCDASFLEYLSAFAAGATLVVPAPEIVAGEPLTQVIQEHAITHLEVTPAILDTLEPDRVPSLQSVTVGGDKCPPALARRWAPLVAMRNSYGPTEATVIVTQTDRMDPAEEVSIGTGLAGVQLLVLDARLRPVPPGARGELYLAGDALARGYIGRFAMTARHFVANPYGPRGSRMYRTGDVVREQASGDMLVYLGRTDAQISLRGQRIEPAEVEHALAADQSIRQAVVRVWTSEKLGDRLIGYVVPVDGDQFDRTAVLPRLRTVLPPAMVPAVLIALDEIPINTASGKTDRTALPDPNTFSRPEFRPPVTPCECAVADAIADTTGQSEVGLDDNFFELGGNSLLGVQLCQRLTEKTDVPVTMQWLFTPTVQALAAAIEAASTDRDSPETVEDDSALKAVLSLRETGSGSPLICLHSAVPLSWCYASLLRYVGDRPVYGLQSPAIADRPGSFRSVEQLADAYLPELIRLQPSGPYHLLGWSVGGQLAHALATRLRSRGSEVGLLVMLDTVAFGDGAPRPVPPTVRDLVTHLQGNERATPDTTPLTVDEAMNLLARGPEPGRGLTRPQFERLHRGYVDCVSMSANYRPEPYDGDLLYFSALQGLTGGLGADMWRPFVGGPITEYSVDVTHAQMTNPEALAVIGPVLDAELNRRH